MHNKTRTVSMGIILSCSLAAGLANAQPPTGEMSFFITSNGPGNGGDLGGLAGADAHCQALAEAAGHGERTWRAYLSGEGENARDRIGSGPWFNARGAQIAPDLDTLHGPNHRMSLMTGLDERGNIIPGSGYTPNRHDILTGSQPDGTAYPEGQDLTCNDWTSSGDDAMARVGHHDYANWNSAHDSRGCSAQSLIATGGDGLFYCFAAD